jgi:pentatricopeptide repeat protein
MVAMRVRPTAVTFNALLNACGTSGEWGAAQATMRLMAASGVECNTRTYNTLISAFQRAGKVELAMDTFWEMQVHTSGSLPPGGLQGWRA